MIGLSHTVRGADKAIANYSEAIRDLRPGVERAVSRGSILLSRETKAQLSGKGASDGFLGRRGADGPFLGVRSGQSRARITPGGQVYRQGNVVFSAVGSPDRHVRFAEDGGTITGKPFLRIPLRAAQTAGGSERGEFLGRSLRDVPGVFVRRTLRGKLMAMRARGKRLVEFTHLLVRSVTQRGRKPFQTVRERVTPSINQMVGTEVGIVMRKANGG